MIPTSQPKIYPPFGYFLGKNSCFCLQRRMIYIISKASIDWYTPNLWTGEPNFPGRNNVIVVEQVFCSSPTANLVGVEDHVRNTFISGVSSRESSHLRRECRINKDLFYFK